MNYFVGAYNFIVEFSSEDDANRFLEVMQQNKMQEADKIAKLCTWFYYFYLTFLVADKQNHDDDPIAEAAAKEKALEMLRKLEEEYVSKKETVQVFFLSRWQVNIV